MSSEDKAQSRLLLLAGQITETPMLSEQVSPPPADVEAKYAQAHVTSSERYAKSYCIEDSEPVSGSHEPLSISRLPSWSD